MVFGCADSSFGRVAMVVACWDELAIFLFCLHVIFHGLGAFIIKTVEEWATACLLETFLDDFAGFKQGRTFAILDRLWQNGVAIVIIGDEEIVVTAGRRNWKPSCKICVNLSLNV